ncbi:MAG: hypothetical protein LBE18_12565 [Planctomycetaceae bacterium]|jgi:NAD-dependent deacetylase|nr:hypothetical protein [Planctomycetaceae bacterium]
MKDLILQFADYLCDSNRVLFITGAGLSADSGLPTYRGVGGLYNNKLTAEGYPIEQCLSASMFLSHPEITWKYMLAIADSIFHCEPNDAHKIIAELESEFEKQNKKVFVLTQNIDGYHKQAGSKNVFEIHGNLRKLFCTNNNCNWSEYLGTDSVTDQNQEIIKSKLIKRLDNIKEKMPPACPLCGSLIRPDIILFEESLPLDVLTQFEYEFGKGDKFDLVISVGTSAMFPYITAPVLKSIQYGKKTVDINPTVNILSESVNLYIQSTAAATFLELKKILDINKIDNPA